MFDEWRIYLEFLEIFCRFVVENRQTDVERYIYVYKESNAVLIIWIIYHLDSPHEKIVACAQDRCRRSTCRSPCVWLLEELACKNQVLPGEYTSRFSLKAVISRDLAAWINLSRNKWNSMKKYKLLCIFFNINIIRV